MIAQAFGGVTPDPNVMSFDRRQRGTFRRPSRICRHPRRRRPRQSRQADDEKHAALLGKVEQQFGVPKELLVAISGPGNQLRRRYGQAADGQRAHDHGA